jgi:hypothetical protein
MMSYCAIYIVLIIIYCLHRGLHQFKTYFRFGYNIVICYEYISKGNNDDALKIINDIENILSSIGNNDPFLKSIKVALNHITFSMKGHLWHLCSMDIKVNKITMCI